MKNKLLSLVIGATLSLGATAAQADTLADVITRGHLMCGVEALMPGLADPDKADGVWRGFNVDYCRAMAAAIFGDAKKVEFVPLKPNVKFTALQSGGIDVLSGGNALTLGREADLGFTFVAPTLYDQQGFMISKKLGVTSGAALSGAIICTVNKTTSELTAAYYFKENGMTYEQITFNTMRECAVAFRAGRCDVIVGHLSVLTSIRSKWGDSSSYMILPTIISDNALGPYVRSNDAKWANIARWTHFAMVKAENLGITSQNANDQKLSLKLEVRNLLGTGPGFGKSLGLSKGWAYNIIQQVGNYGQVYDRNIGLHSPLNIPRGKNALWTKGGLQYAPSFHSAK